MGYVVNLLFDSCTVGPCCARLTLLRRGWVPRMVRSKMYKFQQVGGLYMVGEQGQGLCMMGEGAGARPIADPSPR